MSTDKPEYETVAAAQLVKSSVKLENTVKISEEFLQICELSYTYSKEPDIFNKKQVRAMEMEMEKLYDKVISLENTLFDDIIILAHSYGVLCYTNICFDNKKAISTAKCFTLRSLSLLRDKELHPKSILTVLKQYNNLVHIYIMQQKFDKAIELVDKAVELYFKYNRGNEIPVDLGSIFEPHEQLNCYKKLNILYMSLLKRAIDIYNTKKPINKNYIIAYTHLLLVAHLSILPETKNYYNWIIDAVTLYHNLLKENYFTEARNHITIALSVKKAFLNEKYMSEQVPSSNMLQEYKNVTFHIITCWIVYGVRFLRTSAARLLRLEGDSASNDLKLEYPKEWMSHILQTLISFDEMKGGNPFPNIFDQSMMVKSISGYDDAHKLFVHTLSQLKNVNYSYDPTEKIVTSMEFMLHSSKAYEYMAFYEKNTSQTLLQNRHIEILSKAVQKKIYSKHLFMLKRLQLQLAIGYSILIDAKLENLEEIGSVYMSQRYYTITSEIENLVEKALMNLKSISGL